MKKALAIAMEVRKRAAAKKMSSGGMVDDEAIDQMGSEPNEMLDEHMPDLDLKEEDDPAENKKNMLRGIMEKIRARHMGG